MRTRFLAAAVAAVFATTFSFAAPASADSSKNIDVAICLDTSNSMDGLIDSAKAKLWTIVNDLAKVQPTPTLRVALYQYGNDDLDSKVGWVRKELDLTTDLDEVYKKLNALQTHGGTEFVARVCRDALNDLQWAADNEALRMIFVCGNEPADQDKTVKLDAVAEIARKKGVYINTIYCGPANHPEMNLWKDFAVMAGGHYSNIDQDKTKSQVVVKTPQDAELLKLNEKLNATYVVYGGGKGEESKRNQAVQDANAAKCAPTVALDRLTTKNCALYRCDAWDLVDRMKNDPKFDIKKLKDEELSEEVRKLKPEERVAYVKKKAEEREALRKQIDELNAKRNKFIVEEMKKLPKSDGDKAFDEAVRMALRKEAAAKGLKIPD
jgi:hypothetical protein